MINGLQEIIPEAIMNFKYGPAYFEDFVFIKQIDHCPNSRPCTNIRVMIRNADHIRVIRG